MGAALGFAVQGCCIWVLIRIWGVVRYSGAAHGFCIGIMYSGDIQRYMGAA